jgi:hypothetical protein
MYNKTKAQIMAVYSANTDAGFLKNLLGDNFFYAEKPDDNLEKTYGVFQLTFPDNKKDSADKFETVLMQINLYDESESSEAVGNLAAAAEKTFNAIQSLMSFTQISGTVGHTVTTTIAYVTKSKRDFTRFVPRVDKVWTSVLQYRINLQIFDEQ